MYLSELIFDPWRREVPRLLADSYALHRRLLQAFPDAADGGCGRVLFRAELDKGAARLLVQSEKRPDFRALGALLAGCRGPKEWTPTFMAGQTLHFRLRANMTVKREGKRRVLYGETAAETQAKEVAWLARKGAQHGFALVPLPSGADWFDPFAEDAEAPAARVEVQLVRLPVYEGHKPASEGRGAMTVAHTGVDCNGVLRVTDSALFLAAVAGGIGPAKAFGFGLLSVAPVR